MNEWTEWAERGWGQVVTHGLWTALGGMSVVFAALVLISLFITVLPRILGWADRFLPAVEEHDHVAPPARKPAAAEDEALVAIAFAMHTELQRKGRQ